MRLSHLSILLLCVLYTWTVLAAIAAPLERQHRECHQPNGITWRTLLHLSQSPSAQRRRALLALFHSHRTLEFNIDQMTAGRDFIDDEGARARRGRQRRARQLVHTHFPTRSRPFHQ